MDGCTRFNIQIAILVKWITNQLYQFPNEILFLKTMEFLTAQISIPDQRWKNKTFLDTTRQ